MPLAHGQSDGPTALSSSRLQAEEISIEALNVGSTGGLAAAKSGECDIAPIHLLDPETGEYNRPFLTPALALLPGYRRLPQG